MSATPTVLTALRREDLGKKVARVRAAGRVPAVVFGHGLESVPVSLDAHEFELLRKNLHSNTMIDLRIDGAPTQRVLVHGIHVDPRTRRLLHVDLFALRSGEEVTVDVPLVTTGTSYAAEKLGGTLLHQVDRIRVRALPENLPESIEFSIEPLSEFDKAIHLRDVAMPAGVALLSDPDEIVARVLPPAVTAEAAPTEGAPEEGAEEPAAAGETASNA